jgi:hypothetical protein
MCEIVDSYPPRAEFEARVVEQVQDSGCELSAAPGNSTWGTLSRTACEIVSEFSIPGTQHIVERACKTILGSD